MREKNLRKIESRFRFIQIVQFEALFPPRLSPRLAFGIQVGHRNEDIEDVDSSGWDDGLEDGLDRCEQTRPKC